MTKKFLLTFVISSGILIIGAVLAVGSHGRPELILATLAVATLVGVAGGIAIFIIWV